MMTAPTAEQLAELKALAGPKGYVETPEDKAPYLKEWRDKYQGVTPLVLRPGTVADVSAILSYCNEQRLAIVPQGGNTGLVGGQLPFADHPALLLNLSRLNRVREEDPLNNTITVESGVTLQQVQEAAERMDRLFPLSLASEGTCQIGGNISTNAGGTAVLRYGNTRDLVLGLEVVLPSGEIWHGLKALRKDNTGYDLKQLFIGAEGTLGVITAASLKLFARPRDQQTALVAVGNVAQAIELLSLARSLSGDQVTGFELMPQIGMDFVLKHGAQVKAPFTVEYPWYVLIDLSGGLQKDALKPVMEALLAQAMEDGLILDAVIAQSDQHKQDLWRLRELLSEVQKPEGGSIKHDISVPVSCMPDFIEQATQASLNLIPGCRPVPFGHVGDGNVHFNVSQPVGMDKQAFLDQWPALNRVIHDITCDMDGSISAEHGIGILKRDELAQREGNPAMALMRSIKDTLDPNSIMNPGKLL